MLDVNGLSEEARQHLFQRLVASSLQSYFFRVVGFNSAAGNKNNQKVLPNQRLEIDMIQEELDELSLAFENKKFVKNKEGVKELQDIENVEEQRQHIADAIGDIIYVAMGTAGKLGIDLPRVLHEIALSNETKFNPDGTLSFNDNGKIMKGKDFKEPDLSFVSEPFDFDDMLNKTKEAFKNEQKQQQQPKLLQ